MNAMLQCWFESSNKLLGFDLLYCDTDGEGKYQWKMVLETVTFHWCFVRNRKYQCDFLYWSSSLSALGCMYYNPFYLLSN